MKLAAIALDYDGTIALNGVMAPSIRAAIGEARDAGIAIILATGRRLADLARAAGDLTCFDVIVAENGAVIDFPSRGRHVLLGHTPTPTFVEELKRRHVMFEVGECLIEADAARLRGLETTIDSESVSDITVDIDQTIRARYERISSGLAAVQ
jgi:hydroxymethylpyrimidine pyrophosphatase-like HAD family hydrolase